MGRFVSVYTRGHLIYLYNSTEDLQNGRYSATEENPWRYADNDEIYISDGKHERPCKRCGKMCTEEGHDACLGTIPGVVSACCGHGVEDPYVVTEGGVISEVQGMYTNSFRCNYYEKNKPVISDDIRIFKDPGYFITPHHGCIPIASKIIDNKQYLIWTPVNPMGYGCYKRSIPRDVKFEESDLGIAISSAQTILGDPNNIKLELPDIPLGYSLVTALREADPDYDEETYQLPPFFTSDTHGGYPMTVYGYYDEVQFNQSCPMEINVIRLVFALPLDCEPPEVFETFNPIDFAKDYTEQWALDAHDSAN